MQGQLVNDLQSCWPCVEEAFPRFQVGHSALRHRLEILLLKFGARQLSRRVSVNEPNIAGRVRLLSPLCGQPARGLVFVEAVSEWD